MGHLLLAMAAVAADVCATWGDASSPVVVEDIPDLQSSGVAASRGEPGVFYTHDDGGAAVLHAFTLDGEYLGETEVRGATHEDWEDLAAGPCPATLDGEHCLWIADIGDNDETRGGAVTLWVVPDTDSAAWDAVACNLRYPGGKAWNAEALLVHPDGTVRIVTKEGDGEAHVFVRETPACDGTTEELVEEAELTLGNAVTGGAVSEDGGTVVLRSGTGKLWTWPACGLWAKDPTEVELQLGATQPEAVSFDGDGALITTSEQLPFQVWRVPCEATEEAVCTDCGCATAGFPGALAAALAMLGIARRRRCSDGATPYR